MVKVAMAHAFLLRVAFLLVVVSASVVQCQLFIHSPIRPVFIVQRPNHRNVPGGENSPARGAYPGQANNNNFNPNARADLPVTSSEEDQNDATSGEGSGERRNGTYLPEDFDRSVRSNRPPLEPRRHPPLYGDPAVMEDEDAETDRSRFLWPFSTTVTVTKSKARHPPHLHHGHHGHGLSFPPGPPHLPPHLQQQHHHDHHTDLEYEKTRLKYEIYKLKAKKTIAILQNKVELKKILSLLLQQKLKALEWITWYHDYVEQMYNQANGWEGEEAHGWGEVPPLTDEEILHSKGLLRASLPPTPSKASSTSTTSSNNQASKWTSFFGGGLLSRLRSSLSLTSSGSNNNNDNLNNNNYNSHKYSNNNNQYPNNDHKYPKNNPPNYNLEEEADEEADDEEAEEEEEQRPPIHPNYKTPQHLLFLKQQEQHGKHDQYLKQQPARPLPTMPQSLPPNQQQFTQIMPTTATTEQKKKPFLQSLLFQQPLLQYLGLQKKQEQPQENQVQMRPSPTSAQFLRQPLHHHFHHQPTATSYEQSEEEEDDKPSHEDQEDEKEDEDRESANQNNHEQNSSKTTDQNGNTNDKSVEEEDQEDDKSGEGKNRGKEQEQSEEEAEETKSKEEQDNGNSIEVRDRDPLQGREEEDDEEEENDKSQEEDGDKSQEEGGSEENTPNDTNTSHNKKSQEKEDDKVSTEKDKSKIDEEIKKVIDKEIEQEIAAVNIKARPPKRTINKLIRLRTGSIPQQSKVTFASKKDKKKKKFQDRVYNFLFKTIDVIDKQFIGADEEEVLDVKKK